jgi:hypothetical protein
MGTLPVVASTNLLAKPNYQKTMKKPTKREILAENKIMSAMGITNPSQFRPKMDGIAKFPCCVCRHLDDWTEETCREKCLHFPR